MFVSDLLEKYVLINKIFSLNLLANIIDTIKNFEKKLTGKILQKKKKTEKFFLF